MNRRSLLLGLGAAIAAPAVVRAESLMKIIVPRPALTEEALLDVMLKLAEDRLLISERYCMLSSGWRRIFFDDVSKRVISEEVIPYKPFTIMPAETPTGLFSAEQDRAIVGTGRPRILDVHGETEVMTLTSGLPAT